MYWVHRQTTNNSISRANLDGTVIEDVVTGLVGTLWGFAIDPIENKLYWGETLGRLRRANTDGTDVEDISLTSPYTPRAIALDLGIGKVYWKSDQEPYLRRANLDGSNAEIVVATWAGQGGLVFDDINGVLFASGNIVRIDPIALTVEVLYFGGLDGPTDLLVDAVGKVMYWSGSSGIYKSNLDGTNMAQVLREPLAPLHLALDAPNNTLYWTESLSNRIRRMTIDETLIEDLVTGVDYSKEIALDFEAGHLYWTDAEMIRRANLDGSNLEDVYTGTPGLPPGELTLDAPANQMYWICPEMHRSKLDGSGMEVLMDGFFCWYEDIFVASVPKRVYWSDAQNATSSVIHRADTNMHAISDLVTMPAGTYVTAIAFDCVPYRFGDFDLTGIVDLDDLIMELNGFADPQQYPDGDLYPCGGNGVIDLDDLVVFLEAFAGNELCPGPCL